MQPVMNISSKWYSRFRYRVIINRAAPTKVYELNNVSFLVESSMMFDMGQLVLIQQLLTR